MFHSFISMFPSNSVTDLSKTKRMSCRLRVGGRLCSRILRVAFCLLWQFSQKYRFSPSSFSSYKVTGRGIKTQLWSFQAGTQTLTSMSYYLLDASNLICADDYCLFYSIFSKYKHHNLCDMAYADLFCDGWQ